MCDGVRQKRSGQKQGRATMAASKPSAALGPTAGEAPRRA